MVYRWMSRNIIALPCPLNHKLGRPEDHASRAAGWVIENRPRLI